MPRFAYPMCAVVLALSTVFACGRAPGSGRVLVVALDGLDPEVLELLISEGKLPTFSTLRDRGAWGRLRSIKPLLSPVVWTTIATGRSSLDHQISDFTALDRATGERVPVTSRMRRVKALWNIFSDQGRTAGVVGWWATWPAESIRGTIVSDRLCYHFLFEQAFRGPVDATGLISPASRFQDLSRLVRRPAELSGREVAAFVDAPAPVASEPFDFKDDLSHFRWALATAGSHADIGLRLWESDAPDLLMVYIEAVDTVSHLYGHLFRIGEVSGEIEEQRQRYGHTVERTYEHVDRLVGRFLEKLDDDTTLVVLSDHGFTLGALPDDPSRLRDLRRVSAENHRIDGVLMLYGRGVRPGSRTEEAGILDVAPTLLALAALPASDEMPGRILTEALSIAPPPRTASHEARASGRHDGSGSSVDAQVLEKLRSLGYVGADSPRGDRTRAAILFEAG
ncbi:MAG TPA: alkaline phosphatase family protein, partial [Candidatus Polarisedimenticolia bacterium]|nr:alkaline phosphatase family protein [Candidatus Polarisedimenticolia bacterium]